MHQPTLNKGESDEDELWLLHCRELTELAPESEVVADVAEEFRSILNQGVDRPKCDMEEEEKRWILPYVLAVDLAELSPTGLELMSRAPASTTQLLSFLAARKLYWQQNSSGRNVSPKLCHVVARIESTFCSGPGLLNVTAFSELGTSRLGQLVVIRGTVIRASTPHPVCSRMAYRCLQCHSIRSFPVDQLLEYPLDCNTHKCRSRSFEPVPEEAVCVDRQLLKLQEAVDNSYHNENSSSGGGVAPMIAVELEYDLIDALAAGDVVNVVGILCARRSENSMDSAYQLRIHLLGLNKLQSEHIQAKQSSYDEERNNCAIRHKMEYTHLEKSALVAAASSPGFFDRLVESLCPAIHGHNVTKQALMLALVGGTQRTTGRGSIHVAVFGVPGLGKSQLLRAVCAASPRSIFVAATSASSCGLTLTVVRESDGTNTVDAGALVHGDGGLTCIDEIDKASMEHTALLEVMEQQTISLAKAGMVFSLPIRTTIVAAGNPISGQYNPHKRVTENIGLSPALLSRFDFVFLLSDEMSDPRNHYKVTEHILKRHTLQQETKRSRDEREDTRQQQFLLNHEELTTFIRFVRTECHPMLDIEAKQVLLSEYLRARKSVKRDTQNDMPVTTRHLQALLRATEARAKCSLRHVAMGEDAQFAIGLMRQSRESRLPQGGRISHPLPMQSQRSTRRKPIRERLLDLIQDSIEQSRKKTISHTEVLSLAEEVGSNNPPALVHQLNQMGDLLQISGGRYKLSR